MAVRLIATDLDGTLLDSEKIWIMAEAEALVGAGLLTSKIGAYAHPIQK